MNSANFPEDKSERFSEALKAAMVREKGIHGSVGTQNEKLIHASLKNFYAPFSDEQEIKIGNFFADAVCEDGIFEIQTRSLHRLSEKLKTFLEYSRVTVVHPVTAEYKTLFINAESGEITRETPAKKLRSQLKIFEELYSIRGFLNNENLRVILVRMKIEKRVYYHGEKLPDMKNRSARKKCVIEKIPLEIVEEIVLENQNDYNIFLPENLPPAFTKKELCGAAKEARSSLRTELLRTVGLIKITGKQGNAILYETAEKEHTIG